MLSAKPYVEFSMKSTLITRTGVIFTLAEHVSGSQKSSSPLSLSLPPVSYFSLSLQISQRANKRLRSVSEQTVLRGERRIRETWSSWVCVCLEIHIFFPPSLLHTAGAQLVSIFY